MALAVSIECSVFTVRLPVGPDMNSGRHITTLLARRLRDTK
jgi:hypothetical protein